MKTKPNPEQRLADLMTIKQVARLFRVVPLTVRNWRKRGCPSVVIPGDERDAVRFRLAQVVEWHQGKGHKVPGWVLGRVTRARSR